MSTHTSSTTPAGPAQETAATPRGVFIVVEGGDGAGKTSQVVHLADRLRLRLRRPVLVTRQPGGTPLGAQLRTVLLSTGLGHHTIPPKVEALLYLADRAAHAPLIRQHLAQGDIVISDRYSWSSLVYQGIGRGLDAGYLDPLCRWATDDLEPDLTILLDVDPTVGRQRVAGRASACDRIEAEPDTFHQAVRNGYLMLARNSIGTGRATIVDANQPQDAVAVDVWDALADLDGLHHFAAETVVR